MILFSMAVIGPSITTEASVFAGGVMLGIGVTAPVGVASGALEGVITGVEFSGITAVVAVDSIKRGAVDVGAIVGGLAGDSGLIVWTIAKTISTPTTIAAAAAASTRGVKDSRCVGADCAGSAATGSSSISC